MEENTGNDSKPEESDEKKEEAKDDKPEEVTKEEVRSFQMSDSVTGSPL